MSKDIAKALKKLEYGIYVVTMGKGSEGNAFTASWVSQVSSEPPMVSLAVRNSHQSAPKIKKAMAFAVNMIGIGQDAFAKTWYGPAESGYEKLKSAVTQPTPVTGSPVLNGAIGWLDCKVVNTVEAGNHTLFLAEVVAGSVIQDDAILTSENSNLKYTG